MTDHDKVMEMFLNIKESIARIEEKHKSTHSIVVELKEKVGTQNGRVSKLEGWRNVLTGAWLVVSAVGLIVLKIMYEYFKG